MLEKKDISADEILFELTNNYGSKVAFTVFDNLKSKDNPNKYSSEIISGISRLLDDGEGGVLNNLILNYIATKKLENNPDGVEIARAFFEDSINKTINFYLNIENVISFIDRSNSKYLANTKNILNFILNDARDVEGEINNSLKLIKQIENSKDNDTIFTFENLSFISPVDGESLYRPRNYKNVKVQSAFVEERLSEQEIQNIRETIIINDEYSRKNINKFIMELLNDQVVNQNRTYFKVNEFKECTFLRDKFDIRKN